MFNPDPFLGATLNDSIYYDYISNSSNWLLDYNGNEVICGNQSTTVRCPGNYTCIAGVGENPNDGYTSFDNFGIAYLTTWQVCCVISCRTILTLSCRSSLVIIGTMHTGIHWRLMAPQA